MIRQLHDSRQAFHLLRIQRRQMLRGGERVLETPHLFGVINHPTIIQMTQPQASRSQDISVGSCSVKPSYEVSAVERIIRRKCGRLYGSATTHSPPPTGRHLAAEQPHPGAVPGATVQPDCWSHWTGILPEGVEAACTA